MSALSDHLDRLLHSMEGFGLQPPAQDVRIMEISVSDLNRDDAELRRFRLEERVVGF